MKTKQVNTEKKGDNLQKLKEILIGNWGENLGGGEP